MPEFLDQTFYEHTVRQWSYALLATAAIFLALRLLQSLVVGRLAAAAKRTGTEWDDLAADSLRHTKSLFLLIVAVYVTAVWIVPFDSARDVLSAAFAIAFIVQVGLWLNAAISLWLQSYRARRLSEDAASVTTATAIGFVGKLVLWSIVLVLALDNFGVEITALLAGLGVGGIAIALAVQNILGDLFASLSIVVDKPFVIGDFLIVDNYLGSVEHIGLKSTRLRSLSGEQIVFSNNDLLKSRVRNYGRMYERRVAFTIGVAYQTSREQLRRIPDIIRNAVLHQEGTRFDRSHFKEYGDFSLNFESVYYVLVPDYNVYMDVQQAINLEIHEEFERTGIEFAYPTQTLFVRTSTDT